MNAIPFIGIPVLNRGDLLRRSLMSFDYPVRRIVVVNNGNDPSVAEALDELLALPQFQESLMIYRPGYNMGVAASWNWLCRHSAVDCPYRMLVGNDMLFEPGALQKFHEFTEPRAQEYAMVRCFQGYGILALTERGIRNVGPFDESFYPAYFEDNDHHYRLRLLGEKDTDVSIPLFHGEQGKGSCTINSDPELARRNSITFGNNYAYYGRKWGGPPHHEQFKTPFNRPDAALNAAARDEGNYQANFKVINGG